MAHFFKYHGTGNDFICIDNRKKNISLSSQQIQSICDRHFGIGADGIILMENSENSGDIFMNYYNADGSISEMCGNGVRVTAMFAKDIFQISKKNISVDTRDGIKNVAIQLHDLYCVDMGSPKFSSSDFPANRQNIFNQDWYFASMGNPHAVGVFSSEKSLNSYFNNYGKKIESMTSLFPNKINVNFVLKKGENHFFVKTFERGAGPTLACGTGASASFVWIQKLFPETKGKKIQIDIPGGTLWFESIKNKNILMTGPAKKVFEGNL